MYKIPFSYFFESKIRPSPNFQIFKSPNFQIRLNKNPVPGVGFSKLFRDAKLFPFKYPVEV